MFFRRFYDDGLAQAAYLIACDATGEAVVVDANRDVAQVLAAAAEEGRRITHVTETHIHADFVSGTRELARRAGAKLLLSGEGGRDWQYAFAGSDGAALLRDGDSFSVGKVRLDVLHTPGHTPEHLAFLVTDLASSDRPVGLASGDFVFVGDVGRPDLLEKAAKVAGTMETAARTLFHSLRRFRELPDFVQVWPGHGAGSACGKALGAMPQSTVGYEKFANWGVAAQDEDAFVREVLAGQPDPPPYFAEMKRINRDGPQILGGAPQPPHEDPSRISSQLSANELIVDTRPAEVFARGHIPGTLNLSLGRSLLTWAGWLLPYDRPVHLLANDEHDAAHAARALTMIGLDRVAGWFGPDALDEWTRAGRTLERVVQTDAAELGALLRRGEVTVVDVRSNSEWRRGHLPGALHIPIGQLAGRVGDVPRSHPVVVHCEGGARSAIAASLLLRSGFRAVINLAGGFREWSGAGLPVKSG